MLSELARSLQLSPREAEAVMAQHEESLAAWDELNPADLLLSDAAAAYRQVARPQVFDVLARLGFWLERDVASFVYCVVDPSGPVKIGRARKPLVRLAELQTGNPRPLELRLVMPGAAELEAALHAQFAAGRIRGEWFGAGLANTVLVYTANLASVQLAHYRASANVVVDFARLVAIEARLGGAGA